MTNPFGPNPFGHNPFDSSSPGPPPLPQPPPAPPRDEANVLATLAVVFAFVFAPAGAVLGHLGLRQIRRTGGRGRDRALVGLTLSYVFITAALVALVVGATLPETTPTRTAAPPTTTTTARTTTTPPPPPTVAPADLDGLLPTLDDVKNFTGDQALTVGATYHRPTSDPRETTIDRPDCVAAKNVGEPTVYDLSAMGGYSELDLEDTHDLYNQWSLGGGVAVFHDGTAAQAQLAKLQSIWRRCGGSSMNETFHTGKTYLLFVKLPTDAGNGITALECVSDTPPPIFGVRTIAAKANVFVDVGAWSTISEDRSRQAALAVANHILNKIPG
jgi:eukaryotic-like serine/threonine-protein kinase